MEPSQISCKTCDIWQVLIANPFASPEIPLSERSRTDNERCFEWIGGLDGNDWRTRTFGALWLAWPIIQVRRVICRIYAVEFDKVFLFSMLKPGGAKFSTRFYTQEQT